MNRDEADTVDTLADAIRTIGQTQVFAALQHYLRSVVGHQMDAAFIYVEEDPPVRIYDSEGSAERDKVHAILAEIGYLLSPYYNGLIRTKAEGGFYHIDEVAPDEFRQSEYFEAYYGRKQVCDEGMYLCPLVANTTLVFMVERHRQSYAFQSDEIQNLKELYPIVSAIIARHVEIVGMDRLLTPEIRRTPARFKDIAAKFGHEALSPRERDVAMLILRGHSSKSAARALDISPETERVHRKRLYTKLGLTSHSELFWLFLQASDYFDPAKGNDPLVSFWDANPSKMPDIQ